MAANSLCHRESRRGRAFAGMAVAATLLVAGCERGDAPGPVQADFSAVVAQDPAEYSSYQVKITYTSVQTKAVPTLLLTGEGAAPSIGDFEPYRSGGVHYGNDETHSLELTVSGETIHRLVEAIGRRPPLTTSGGGRDPFFSLMIQRGRPPNESVFEHLCDEIDAAWLVDLLEAAARGEEEATFDSIRVFRNVTVGPR